MSGLVDSHSVLAVLQLVAEDGAGTELHVGQLVAAFGRRSGLSVFTAVDTDRAR